MIGVVIVSHSHTLAEGVAELAREMGGGEVKVVTVGVSTSRATRSGRTRSE